MKHRFFRITSLIFFAILSISVSGEGTKEMCPNSTDMCNLYLATSGYTNFARYTAAPNYRLYIHIQNVGETILWGLNCQSNNMQYRLKDPSGNIVFSGTAPSPTNGQPGLISNYAQAVTGPFPGSGGYTPNSYQVTSAAAVGDYYIEFNLISGNLQFDYFDFTVVSGANNPAQTSDVILGRVFSQSWQLYSALQGTGPGGQAVPFNGKFYVYSDDGIVTSLTFSHAHVGAFTVLCNQYGVTNTGNFTNDRKSSVLNTTTTFPGIAQYKVFFNNPDPNVYPDGVYGSMTAAPQIIPDPAFPECSGKKIIIVTVNKAGTVDIMIDVPYGTTANDVHLYQTVVPGVNNIPWDGKDGLGNQVIDGTNITVTVTYLNGLTNLPLWDIEQNQEGFIVNLVRPVSTGINPLVYWDDSGINSGAPCPNGSNLAGCSPSGSPPVPGCHPWANGTNYCHDKMINTWWFSASSSTATLNVYYSGDPNPPVGTDAARCGPGTVNLSATVNSQQTVDWYTSPTGGVPLLSGNTNFTTPVLGSNTTYYTETRNPTSGCLSLTRTPVTATINPIPPAPTGVSPVWRCGAGSVVLSANSPGITTYWFDVPTGGGSLFIGDNFTTPFLSSTTTYYAEAQNTITQCISPTRLPVVAEIRPVPQINNTVNTFTICSGSTTNILLTADQPGTAFTWTATLLSGSLSGYSGGTGNLIAQTLINTGVGNAVVDYSVTPSLNSCTGNPFHFVVTVNTLTIPVIAGSVSSCIGTSKTYTTAAGMSNYLWNVSGGTITGGGTTSDNSITITWNTLGTQSVSVNYTDPSGCTADNPTVYNVTVNPLPVPAVAGSTGVCVNTPGIVYSTQAGQANYSWSIPSGGTITSGGGPNDNTATVTWNTPGNQIIRVNYTDANGCTATAATDYNVTVFPLPVPALGGNASVCLNSTGNVYATDALMANYVWSVSAGGQITAGGGSSDNSVTIKWIATGPQTVSVSYTNGNGCQPASPMVFPVTVNALPTPSISGPTPVCEGSTGVVYTTEGSKTNYLWTVSPGGTITAGGTPSDPTTTVTWNTAGNRNLTINYTDANGCTAAVPVIYPVLVNPRPVPVIAGPAAMCLNEQATYTVQPGMSGYLWSVPAGGTIVSGAGTSNLVILWNAIGVHTISVNYTDANGCTAATPSTYNITVNTLPDPSLSGTTSICTGFQTTYTSDLGMNNYLWNISAGGSIVSGGGTNNNTVTVLWTGVGAQTVSVNYTVGTGCTAPQPKILNVTVNPLPVPALSGPTPICNGTTGNVYTTDPSMSGYTWTISGGGTITGGGTGSDNTVTVSWNAAGPQTVKVNYTNGNGCTALSQTTYPVTVNPLPLPTIAGPSSICLNATGTYTTEAAQNNYSWTVTPGGTITSGAGTNSITVQWNTVGPQVITVNYFDANGCTAAAAKTHAVTVNPLPSPAIAGSNVVCQTNTVTYSTAPGMTSYLWSVSPGGTIVSGGGLTDASMTINWTTAGNQTVTVNYTIPATGCTAATPTSIMVTVKPKPAVSNGILAFQQCNNLTTNIVLQSTVPGSTYDWTASGSSGALTGFSSNSGPVIAQTLNNSGSNTETVTYIVTPTANSCQGDPTNFVVTVYPTANVTFTPPALSFCSGGTAELTLTGTVTGTTFTWTATPSSANINGYSAGSGNNILQVLNNTGYMIENVEYAVTPVANGCTGTLKSMKVFVNPLPVVTYPGCIIDVTTTDAKPFRLKGGLPLGGTYSGPGVIGSVFNPAVAGAGMHTISYAYNNTWGCSGSQTHPVTVLSPLPFVCGSPLTDVRDNTVYPTVLIGTQCWMAADLNYGTSIIASSMQRDNCSPEKYCYADNPANCTSRGGLYEWDEVMQYDNTAEGQGLCPPAWHVPSEVDWNKLFNTYTSNGFAGDPLKYTGFSGFNSYFNGGHFDNREFNYQNFAVFYWSSTGRGPYKAWGHALNDRDPSVSVYPGNRAHAMYVRCIKD